jgi:hypothetical protein
MPYFHAAGLEEAHDLRFRWTPISEGSRAVVDGRHESDSTLVKQRDSTVSLLESPCLRTADRLCR